MTNEQIIADVAISSGIYTEEEINTFIENGVEIPLHTFKGWTSRGNFRIKAGEHGIETKLWKRRKKTDNDKVDGNEESNKGDFYLAKAFLFTENQVELVEGGNEKCAV